MSYTIQDIYHHHNKKKQERWLAQAGFLFDILCALHKLHCSGSRISYFPANVSSIKLAFLLPTCIVYPLYCKGLIKRQSVTPRFSATSLFSFDSCPGVLYHRPKSSFNMSAPPFHAMARPTCTHACCYYYARDGNMDPAAIYMCRLILMRSCDRSGGGGAWVTSRQPGRSPLRVSCLPIQRQRHPGQGDNIVYRLVYAANKNTK